MAYERITAVASSGFTCPVYVYMESLVNAASSQPDSAVDRIAVTAPETIHGGEAARAQVIEVPRQRQLLPPPFPEKPFVNCGDVHPKCLGIRIPETVPVIAVGRSFCAEHFLAAPFPGLLDGGRVTPDVISV